MDTEVQYDDPVLVGYEAATGSEEPCYDCSRAFNTDQEMVRFRYTGAEDTYLVHTHCWKALQTRVAQDKRLRNPSIDIAAYRNSDGEFDLVVFVNGQKMPHSALTMDVVDPDRGHRYERSEWRRKTFDAARAGGSRAWVSQVAAFYARAEADCTVNDITTARDGQPGVTRLGELDPAVWGTELTGDVEDNNTAYAAWALTAVLAVWRLSTTVGSLNALAETARGAFVAVGGDNGGDLDTTIQDLLNCLRHLADARALSLDVPIGTDGTAGDELRHAVELVITALRHAHEDSWAQLTERVFTDIEQSAFDRYVEDLRGAGEFPCP